MKKGKFLLFIVWILAIFLLTLIAIYNQSKVDKFMGLTSSKDHLINFAYPVELKKAFVLSGNEVKKGDLLAELIRTDVVSQIEILNNKISILETQKRSRIDEINTELNSLAIKYQLDIDNIKIAIEQSKYQLAINKKLLKTIIEIDSNTFKTLNLKIQSLESEKKSIESAYSTKTKYLTQQLEYEKKSSKQEINTLKEEQKILSAKEEKLNVYAPIDGEVEMMAYSENSQIKPFDSLLNIHSKYPEFVTGFIHEDIINELKIGQKVAISSINDVESKNLIYGTVESIENKLEDIPAKLKKYKIIPLWGYKVLIKIPQNSLKLGERVIITTTIEKSFLELQVSKFLEFLKLK